MKILIIDVNFDHASGAHRSFKNSLADIMDVSFYGPGYSSREVLDKGLHEFLSARGGTDIILVGSELLFNNVVKEQIGSNVEKVYSEHRFLMSKYLINEALIYAKTIEEELLQIKNIPLVLLVCSDLGTLNTYRTNKTKKLLNHGFYLKLCGEDFLTGKYNGKRFGHNIGNNNAYHLVKDNHERVISMPFQGVNEHNYYFADLESRKFEWVVPGNISSDYPQRGEVSSSLKKEGVSIWSSKNRNDQLIYKKSMKIRLKDVEYNSKIEKFISLFYKNLIYIPNQIPLEKVAMYREVYLEGLRNSKCAYVEGSNLKLLVNKYFEVPAAGCLMVGDMVTGLDKMGFVPGKHMVEASPKNIYKVYQQLLKDKEKMQEIASNGRKLVIEKHTFRCRAVGLKRAFEAILDKDYKGSHWENGDFIVESSGARE